MLPPRCFDLFSCSAWCILLDLFWLHNPFSRCWGDKQTYSKHLNFARKLLDWLVPSAALRIFVAMILYELQLDAGAASKAIHHESLGCDSFFKPGGLWLRYHDLHLHHESSWIMMYSTHTIPPKESQTQFHIMMQDIFQILPVWSPVLRPLLPQILYQICTTQVQRWYASFSVLGPAGMFLTEVRQRRLQASWNEGGVVVRINSGLRGNSWQVSFSTWSVLGDVDRYCTDTVVLVVDSRW